jgi:hypothetical protein
MNDDGLGENDDEIQEGELPIEPDPVVNAADERSLRKRKVGLKIQEREAERFWAGVFNDPVGRREMWRLLQSAHPFEERFACGPNGFPQPEATWFHAGEQSLGLRLYQTWLCKFPDLVMLMHAEHDPRFAKPIKGDK